MIEINDLCYRYHQEDKGWVIDHLHLKIEQGEFVAVLGHNGSGKSTLARHLNALLYPVEGEVIIDGLDTRKQENLWKIRQQVGMVFQNPDNQLVATVVEEDVAFGPENLGIEPSEIRRRVKDSLQAVGMASFARREPHLLSGGQKQRVAIAGVLAMQPKFLILDEPTAMLDPRGRLEVMQTVARLNREMGLTVINITHFMEEAAQAQRVVVLEEGRIFLQGTPREVFSRADNLKKIGLDVPQMVELRMELVKRGLKLPADILTSEEMVEALCALN